MKGTKFLYNLIEIVLSFECVETQILEDMKCASKWINYKLSIDMLEKSISKRKVINESRVHTVSAYRVVVLITIAGTDYWCIEI